MKVRRVSLAFVSAAFLAAFAMNGSSAFAASSSASSKLARSAYQALQAGDVDGAISQYSKAIGAEGLEPEVLANALLNRALAFQQKGQNAEAIADYTSALDLDAMAPTLRATALYNRGLSQQKLGDISKAVEDFTGALLLNPEFAHAYYGRGNALRDSGQLLFALSDYERAQQFKHPEPAKIFYGEAVTYIALRRPQDARKALQAVLDLQPEHAGAIGQLAKLNSAADNSVAEADDILTGSVAALSGGTVAKKLPLPKAQDVPEDVMPSVAKNTVAKKYTDRLPSLETANYISTSEPIVLEPESQAAIKVEEVPAIPEPVQAETAAVNKKPVKVAKAKPVVVDEEQIANVEPEVEAATEVAVASGWMVQLASAASEDAAWSTWKKMQNRNKALKSLKPIVVRADLGTKGVFYRVRLNGFDGQSDAKSACGKLKAKGVSCYVSKA